MQAWQSALRAAKAAGKATALEHWRDSIKRSDDRYDELMEHRNRGESIDKIRIKRVALDMLWLDASRQSDAISEVEATCSVHGNTFPSHGLAGLSMADEYVAHLQGVVEGYESAARELRDIATTDTDEAGNKIWPGQKREAVKRACRGMYSRAFVQPATSLDDIRMAAMKNARKEFAMAFTQEEDRISREAGDYGKNLATAMDSRLRGYVEVGAIAEELDGVDFPSGVTASRLKTHISEVLQESGRNWHERAFDQAIHSKPHELYREASREASEARYDANALHDHVVRLAGDERDASMGMGSMPAPEVSQDDVVATVQDTRGFLGFVNGIARTLAGGGDSRKVATGGGSAMTAGNSGANLDGSVPEHHGPKTIHVDEYQRGDGTKVSAHDKTINT